MSIVLKSFRKPALALFRLQSLSLSSNSMILASTGAEAQSQSFCGAEKHKRVELYLKNWEGSFRLKINQSVEEIMDDKDKSFLVQAAFIDHRQWKTYIHGKRRHLVKGPMKSLECTEKFLNLCSLLENVKREDLETSSSQLRFVNSSVSTDTGEDMGKGMYMGGVENGADPSLSPSLSPARAALNDFIFAHIFEAAQRDLSLAINSSKALHNISDLRIPHEWYPYARLMKRKVVFHGGPTNSGKTYHALKRLRQADAAHGGGLYCGPLRLLALEVYEQLNKQGIVTDLLTGQEKRTIPLATHISSTLEMVNLQRDFDVAVIDEIQMISHEQRGHAWTRALYGLRAREIHVCGGMEALSLVKKLVEDAGDDFELVEYNRLSHLCIAETSLQGDYSQIKPGDCVVAFSRAEIFSIRQEIEKLTPYKCCMVYGQLPPETRSMQARLFNEDNTGFDVLVASDAIGMGLNLNIGRIVFHTTVKKGVGPSGSHFIDPTTVKQIAGRAGRLSSRFEFGEVTAWQEADLAYIKGVMDWEIPQLKEAGLFPSEEQVESFSEKLGGLINVSDKKKEKGKSKDQDKLLSLSSSAKRSSSSSSFALTLSSSDGVAVNTSASASATSNSSSSKSKSKNEAATKISSLMERFVELAQMDGRFFMCDHEDMVTVANWLHTIPLSLADRFLFANAPVNTQSSLNMNLLYQFAATYAQSRPVATNVRIPKVPPRDMVAFTDLCAKHNALDLYLWLSARFPKYFVERDICLEQKAHAVALIEGCLHKSTLDQEFSHVNSYRKTRTRITAEGNLPPLSYGDVRKSTEVYLSVLEKDSKELFFFPHASSKDEDSAVRKPFRAGVGEKGGRRQDRALGRPSGQDKVSSDSSKSSSVTNSGNSSSSSRRRDGVVTRCLGPSPISHKKEKEKSTEGDIDSDEKGSKAVISGPKGKARTTAKSKPKNGDADAKARRNKIDIFELTHPDVRNAVHD